MKEVYQESIPELYKKFNSSENGLSLKEVALLISTHGPNTIKEKRKFEPLKVFLSQFNSFLIYILIIAAAISFFIGHLLDGFVISSIILLNAIIGFTQQFKAEKAIANLKKLIVPMSKVIRQGVVKEIPSRDLVPGDIIILEAGDKINADARIIESENAATNEAALTGESLPISKEAITLESISPLSERKNMLFTGTSFVRGTAKALVVNTGIKTIFGQIAEELQEIKISKTPMQKRLDKFSKQIGLIILAMVSIIALLGFFEKFDLIEMFLIAVALAVSAIPEGLPAVLTIGFAISSLLMSKKNVVIRRLPAVESLGSVTVICTDKTGTLTEEKMTIEEMYASGEFYEKEGKSIIQNNKKINLQKSKELIHLIKTSILCNNSRYELIDGKPELLGDPTENALLETSLDLGFNKKSLVEENPSIKKFEFDSIRKMMSILRDTGKNNTLYTKGAIQKVLEKSSFELINGQVRHMGEKRKNQLLEEAKKMESKALRVLAFAYKVLSKSEKVNENNLIFIGFAGMIDPPRPEVKKAIQECKDAGIKVKIITGDSEVTAKAIGEKIGIVGRVVNEIELEKMSNEELLKSIHDIVIFARVTPKQKLRITQALQSLHEIVAITGDGINDVLALKSADVGIAMGKRGTDVAREVSDIVLVDDNFASIVEGVKEGRKTYDNIKKFTKYLLAVNFAEIFLVLFALIFDMPLPLIALQILWINLVSDSFPSLSLIFEKDENIMKSKPRNEKSILSGIWTYIIVAGILAFAVKLTVYLISLNQGNSIELTRTIVLTAAILYELFFVYTVRSKMSLFKMGIFSNKWMNLAFLGSLILHLILLYTPLGQFFQIVPLTLNNWLFLLPFALSGLIIFEIAKVIKLKRNK
jgi:Ca2+-transporting ATPase